MTCQRLLAGVLLACGWSVAGFIAAAQEPGVPPPAGLLSRKATAVTYEARRTTKIDLIGTPLLPRARGEAEIATDAAGPVRIKAKVRDVAAASQFGTEYLTFVMWAVPPQGRSKNLGELRLDDGEAEIEATADVQTFALIVTAEPYYAVTTPSELVVLENAVRADTRGRTSIAELQYEIVRRGAYIGEAGGRYSLPEPSRRDPPDVQQARNAVGIARIAQAGTFEPAGFATAERLLTHIELLVKNRGSSRDIVSYSRAAVQAAEEARLQSVARRIAADAEAARTQAAAREQAARTAAAEESAARRAAEEERSRAERAAQEAVRERERAEQAVQEAARQQELAEEARREAEDARRQAELARASAEAQATRADELRAKAEQDQASLRSTLLRQFGEILEARDTSRGLVVSVGDVLFETGQYELRPLAREKLARFAGIVLAHQGLEVQAEGFTDSTGTDAVNQRLSQQRADAVAEYLLAQGLSRSRVAARGYGASNPIASNETREGRQQNRRVEIVVAGEVIGTTIDAARR